MESNVNSIFEQLDPEVNYFNSIHSSLNLPQNSDYITIADYNNSTSTGLVILSYNIRSFRKNINSFLSIFNNHSKPPDVFIFTETWFKRTTVQNIPGYKAYHSIREGSQSGGVSIYIKDHIDSIFHENFTSASNSTTVSK